MNKLYGIVLLTVCFISCKKSQDSGAALFTLLDSEHTGIEFINKVENRKDFNIFKYRNFYNGGGVAIGDINEDGLVDIYLTSNMGKNKLYLNKGGFKFEDITMSAGVAGERAWSTGVVMVDMNSDGLLDIYVCNAGNIKGDNQKNELFINQGDGTFVEEAEKYNIADSGFTTHAAFFDYDKDGDLDLYILNNSFLPVNSLGYVNKRNVRASDWDIPDMFKGGGDKLMRNEGGKFVDVSEESGIYGSLIGFGLGVTVGDVNNDNWLDIYVSNDFYERDYLYINNRDGTFTEDIKSWVSHLSLFSMGADMSDINNDGLNDIFVTDMLPEPDNRLKNTTKFESYNTYQLKLNRDFYHQYMQNTLQLNRGDNRFAEIAFYAGVAKTDWSWGALLFDMDNDGHKDIYVCNGINHDLTNQDFIDFFANEIIQEMVLTGRKEEVEEIINKMPSKPLMNYAFRNESHLSFSNKTQEWGFAVESFSNGASYADLDNDGDLDLVINNVNQDLFVYRNNTNEQLEHDYIQLKLEGEKPNLFAVGAKVYVFSGEEIMFQELIPTRGFQSSTDYRLTFGLGKKEIDSVRVVWPGGKQETRRNVERNRQITLYEKEAKDNFLFEEEQKIKTYLKELPDLFEAHQENIYNDFDVEGLIFKKLSDEGPAACVADINNDGRDDVFVGGAKGQPGMLYLQKEDGHFTLTVQAVFEKDKTYEDTAAAFFDADLDGDQDLFVGSGGNEVYGTKNDNRLYINDGKGYFERSAEKIPSTGHNVSVVLPMDYDGDEDIDIFVGSRSVPAVYGIHPKHLLLENDGKGVFRNVTDKVAYDLHEVGMLADAEQIDVDNDGKQDLVLVGDWMAPVVLKNHKRYFKRLKTNLEDYSGWWNRMEVKDIDNDGDDDIVIGNRGNNFAYQTSMSNPSKIYINDFDDNGTIEQIYTRNLGGKDVPVMLKDDMTNQLVSLKKQNLKYSEYAEKSIDELFDKKIVARSIVKEVNTSESIIAVNEGGGHFKIKILPKEVQLSCVCAITCMDINKDGLLDIIMGGNDYGFKPQFSRLDASYGYVLLGKKDGGFDVQDYAESGFFVSGEIKHILPIKTGTKRNKILVVRNNDTPKLFSLNE